MLPKVLPFFKRGNRRGGGTTTSKNSLENPVQEVFQTAGWQTEWLMKGMCELNTSPMQIVKRSVHNHAGKHWASGEAVGIRSKYAESHQSISVHEQMASYRATWPTRRALQSPHSNDEQTHSGSNEHSAKLLRWLSQFLRLSCADHQPPRFLSHFSCTSILNQQTSNSHLQFFPGQPLKTHSCFLSDIW